MDGGLPEHGVVGATLGCCDEGRPGRLPGGRGVWPVDQEVDRDRDGQAGAEGGLRGLGDPFGASGTGTEGRTILT
jgi:hypothetical protein